ncbi:zinc transporter 8-like [Elaeis guineensis]|uniref:Zinc transporter 8-like n=1 Tax=Elaeis guineensis var. tenera TaxID=51953 RepID=A0A6I9R9M2_ELAGV|nr:zinc transporter 8-like [Elaeis guineensis]
MTKTGALHLLLLTLLVLPVVARGADCEFSASEEDRDKAAARPLKIGAIFAILVSSATGVIIPILGKWVPSLSAEKDTFFVIKAFAAGVILATAFIHILPESFERLTSPCLDEHPWQEFPFAGFIAMVSAIATLMVDTVATSYFGRSSIRKAERPGMGDAEQGGAPHVHVHAMHGHGHGPVALVVDGGRDEISRHRVISQVLELGIVVHSVIIGVTLGTSESPSSIRSLLVALCFHQFFEGIGLGGCVVQANFRVRSMVTMMLFFALTTPLGIAVGIGISSTYNENSPTALTVEGVLDSAAAGILVYMSLVDLLAEDFKNPRVQSNWRLQLVLSASLLVGAGLMSLLAKWA